MFVLTSRGWIKGLLPGGSKPRGIDRRFLATRCREILRSQDRTRLLYPLLCPLFFSSAQASRLEENWDLRCCRIAVPDSPTCPISSRASPLPRSVFPDISLSRHLYVAMRVLHLARVVFTRGYSVSYASMVCIVFYVCVCVSYMSFLVTLREFTCVHAY